MDDNFVWHGVCRERNMVIAALGFIDAGLWGLSVFFEGLAGIERERARAALGCDTLP
jgi:hypothetical protein